MSTMDLGPADEHNRRLLALTHPPEWTNPHPAPRYNLVVIGGGTAGLVSAVGAAGLGARVALVERHLLGGDCLITGCVPSKALLRSARAAYDARGLSAYGVATADPRVSSAEAFVRLRRLRAAIAPDDSADRLTRAGVDVFLGAARFVCRDTVEVDGRRLRFARAVIATGGRPAVPPIPGLAETGFQTSDTVFSLEAAPRRLVVIGGGPIGCELAQAFARLGCAVTLLARQPRLLPRDDPDASSMVESALRRDGVIVETAVAVLAVAARDGDRLVHYEREGDHRRIAADEVLVATGRSPNIEGLGLDDAGVEVAERGVVTDDYLRTTNADIYAAGDVAGHWQFTHAADAMARIVIQNALFFGRRRLSALVVPWCTYTDPEVAHVGLSAADAEARRDEARTFTVRFDDVHRAVLDGETDGFARAHADSAGRILGATVVARHAGDLIGELSLAMTNGIRLGGLSRTIHPYPTQAEALKKLGDAWMRTRLTPRAAGLLKWLMRVRGKA